MPRVLLNVPARAERGAVIAIRALIMHPMETGFRVDANGAAIARDIITRFTCAYGDAVVFEAALSPAIAANPYLAFTVMAVESGRLTFTWTGDDGFAQTEMREIVVT